MKNIFSIILCSLLQLPAFSQLQWKNVDSLYQPLPASFHVYTTEHRMDTAPFRAFYISADLNDKSLTVCTDTTLGRRLTPSAYYTKNNQPLVVVNGTFFSFQTNQNLTPVMMNGRLVSFTAPVKGRGADSLLWIKPFKSAIGFSKKGKPDAAWLRTDSSKKYPIAFYKPVMPYRKSTFHRDSIQYGSKAASLADRKPVKWKMKTAIGGGPMLVYNSAVFITNNEEMMFAGKAIHDKHPRTAIGYTADNRLIILVVEGRTSQSAGASLNQLASVLQALGCVRALNLDGGGSSCLLVNGKETIKPSDKEGQRPVPAVLMISRK